MIEEGKADRSRLWSGSRSRVRRSFVFSSVVEGLLAFPAMALGAEVHEPTIDGL